MTTFEAMCGHCLFIAEEFLDRGASILMPQLEQDDVMLNHPESRERDIREVLTDLQPDGIERIGEEVALLGRRLQQGDTVVVFVGARDDSLVQQIQSQQHINFVCLVYDADDYFVKAKAPAKQSAADPVFLAQLESAGAQVITMPKVETIK